MGGFDCKLACGLCSAVLALVGHDLDESDARGFVDADVDELPGPHGANPAELLDVEMD